MNNVEDIASSVIDTAFHIHKDLGPGLLESVYEVVLAKTLEAHGFQVERQKPIPIVYAGFRFDEGFRADLLVNGKLLIELKSIEKLAPVHGKQVLTYLCLLDLPLGLLINFGAETFRQGVRRIVNNHQQDFAASVNENICFLPRPFGEASLAHPCARPSRETELIFWYWPVLVSIKRFEFECTNCINISG